MVRTLLMIFTLQALTLHVSAQNLVPNSGFEDYASCPTSYSGVTFDDVSFPYVQNWFAPTGGSSDYFNACADLSSSVSIPNTYYWDYNPSHLCNAMAGFFTYEDGSNYREYLEVQFTEPMTAGTLYYIEFYAATACYPGGVGYDFIFATDELGAYISEDKVLDFDYTPLSYLTPQIENPEGLYLEDSSAWYKISGTYLATGGEEYITIGNFKDDDETDFVYMEGTSPSGSTLSGYVFVDDVLVTEYTGAEPTTPGDVILCDGESVDLTAPFSAISYDWSTGDDQQTITVDEAGTYSVSVEFDCIDTVFTFNVYTFPTDAITSYTADYICMDDFPITLDGAPGFTDYDWNTGEFTESIVVSGPGVYSVLASNVCTIQKDTFEITALDPSGIDLNLGNDTLICTNDPWSVLLDASDDFETYEWSTGETTQTITVDEDGVYSISAENICGTWTDVIKIESGAVLSKPELGDNVVLCEQDNFSEVTFTVPEQDCDYLWQNGDTTNSITVHEPGEFWVQCSNLCGVTGDSVIVQLCTYIYMANAFSPNGDGLNDIYAPVAYEGVDLVSFVIYDRWGELLFETNDITKGWDGTVDGKEMPVAAYAFVVQYDEYGYVEQRKGSFTLVR